MASDTSDDDKLPTQGRFTRFRKLDVDHSVNVFYEVRP